MNVRCIEVKSAADTMARMFGCGDFQRGMASQLGSHLVKFLVQRRTRLSPFREELPRMGSSDCAPVGVYGYLSLSVFTFPNSFSFRIAFREDRLFCSDCVNCLALCLASH
jgi:hypothetical protein